MPEGTFLDMWLFSRDCCAAALTQITQTPLFEAAERFRTGAIATSATHISLRRP